MCAALLPYLALCHLSGPSDLQGAASGGLEEDSAEPGCFWGDLTVLWPWKSSREIRLSLSDEMSPLGLLTQRFFSNVNICSQSKKAFHSAQPKQ